MNEVLSLKCRRCIFSFLRYLSPPLFPSLISPSRCREFVSEGLSWLPHISPPLYFVILLIQTLFHISVFLSSAGSKMIHFTYFLEVWLSPKSISPEWIQWMEGPAEEGQLVSGRCGGCGGGTGGGAGHFFFYPESARVKCQAFLREAAP